MPTVINGLPAHVLLIHVVVVLIPLGALFTVLSAVWPAARRRLGFISPLTCLIALIFVPITTNAGEWLEHKLQQNGRDAAIEKHADLGESFLWFALVLFLVSAAVWWLGRRADSAPATEVAERSDSAGGGTALATEQATTQATGQSTIVTYLVAAVAIVVAVVVTWQLYRIGDSGAKAAWDYVDKIK